MRNTVKLNGLINVYVDSRLGAHGALARTVRAFGAANKNPGGKEKPNQRRMSTRRRHAGSNGESEVQRKSAMFCAESQTKQAPGQSQPADASLSPAIPQNVSIRSRVNKPQSHCAKSSMSSTAPVTSRRRRRSESDRRFKGRDAPAQLQHADAGSFY